MSGSTSSRGSFETLSQPLMNFHFLFLSPLSRFVFNYCKNLWGAAMSSPQTMGQWGGAYVQRVHPRGHETDFHRRETWIATLRATGRVPTTRSLLP